MLNLRSAVQRCVRRASIVGSSPLRHHTSRNNSNVIYVSRQTFADANVELVENASQHSGIKHLSKIQTTAVTESKKLPDKANDPEAEETTSNTDTKSLNTTESSKNLEFRRYHICVSGFSENVTADMLQEFYSRYGEVIRCEVWFGKQRKKLQATVVFSEKEAMNLAVSSFPHRINNEKVYGGIGHLNSELTLRVLNLSPETTEESLKEFYSRFGNITRCVMNEDSEGKLGYVAFRSHEELDRALDAQPHLIDGSAVFLNYPTGELEMKILDVPEGITEESLRTYFSRYGQLRQCNLFSKNRGKTHAHLLFSTVNELDRALDAQPHLIDGSAVFLNYPTGELEMKILDVPEGITEESLRTYFSRYGQLRQCNLFSKNRGKTHAHLLFSTVNEVNHAMQNRPHIIDRKLLRTDFVGKRGLFPIFVGSLPENVTRALLFKAFSKFGKIVHLELHNGSPRRGPFGIIDYGTQQEANKAVNAGPHEVEGMPVYVEMGKEIDLESRKR